jgi:predicted RNase H-like nuclease (RuvC/YqgF family)
MKRSLAEEVGDLEDTIEKLESTNRKLAFQVKEHTEVITDLRQELIQANLRVCYYESIYPGLEDAWEVRQRMEVT